MAQNSVRCQFCKISLEVKWKCKTCDVIFCDSCRLNIHAILKNSHEHDVMDFKDTERNCSDNVDLKSIPCSTHLEQSCLIYCRNCDKSLCSSCLIYPSDQTELTRIYHLRRESLDELKQQIENTLPFFEAKSAEFRSLDSKVVITAPSNNFWNPDNNPVTQQKEILETIEEDLKQRRDDLEDALEESSASYIFPVFEKINKDIPAQITVQVNTSDLIYIESMSNDSFFGSIIEIPTFKLAHTFAFGLPDISAIVTLNEETCVLYSAKNPTYGKRYTYEPRNGRVVTLGEWGQPKWTYSGKFSVNRYNKFTPLDIVTTIHGHILIADRESSTIHVVSKNGQFIAKFCHDDIVHPNSLNIDKMGRLLIGCSSDWDGGNHEDDAGRCQTSKLHVVEFV
ncbi:TRIM46 [Mytilus edulis]|uniref:TRIM46 n=1 Tax=Mytilus edulis TaxID=6550 RepID=A0A8S3V3D1_MYTED|nr:TRIM46 [Mytilus edulis]